MLHCTTPTHPGVFRQVCIDTRTLRMLLNICVCSVAACDCNLAIVLFLQFERKKERKKESNWYNSTLFFGWVSCFFLSPLIQGKLRHLRTPFGLATITADAAKGLSIELE